jgi:hypothetical protein
VTRARGPGRRNGYTHGVFTAPTRCQATVVAAGVVVFYERPRPSVWWALLDRDRAEIARRQRHPRGDGPGGEAVQPLARGRQARELIARVRRWADRHPEQLYPAAPPDRPPARE